VAAVSANGARSAEQRYVANLCLSACGFPKRGDYLCGQIRAVVSKTVLYPNVC